MVWIGKCHACKALLVDSALKYTSWHAMVIVIDVEYGLACFS
jgi:hypothetical protein